MSLCDVMTGSVLFTLASAASLQVWSRVSASAVEAERRLQLLDRADAELLVAEGALRRHVALLAGAPGADCVLAAERLSRELAAMPVVDGLERRVSWTAGGDRVVVSLVVQGMPQPRRRLYVPGALGLCVPLPVTEEGEDAAS